MARSGDILISAGEGHGGPAQELLSALSGRGLSVRTVEGGRPPTEPVDVFICFTDADISQPSAIEPAPELGDVAEKGLARAAVVVSDAPSGEDIPSEISAGLPVLRADPGWGAEVLAEVTEAALVLAREHGARLRAERRLGELAKVQESFSAIASHDLRTPVTTLRLLKDLLASQLSAKADLLTAGERVSTDELLGIMSRSLDKMDAFIGDMLEAWRLSPGLPETAAGPVGLNGVVEDIVASLFPVAIRKEIVLDLAADPEVGLVLGETRRVGQVVSNVVGNALKFTAKGGSVTVTTRPATREEAEGTESEQGEGAVLEVADTGPGIAEEDGTRVFRRFGRGKARATGGEPSTGLGLYICKEIVELYGGRIWFESVPGKGSHFFVYFRGARRKA